MPKPKPQPKTKLLKSGLHPLASNALKAIGVPASRITQTYGYADKSKGYHAPEPGTKPFWKIEGREYSAAVDLSVRNPTKLNDTQIKDLLEKMGKAGFAAWSRDPAKDEDCWGHEPHIHAVYAGIPMKEKLKAQVRDYLHVEPKSGLMRNGLNPVKPEKCRHALYHFWTPSDEAREKIRSIFEPVNGARALEAHLVDAPLAPEEDETEVAPDA